MQRKAFLKTSNDLCRYNLWLLIAAKMRATCLSKQFREVLFIDAFKTIKRQSVLFESLEVVVLMAEEREALRAVR